MIHQFFLSFFAFLVNIMPFGDVGLAVISLTLVVKFALMPLSKKALQSQIKMKALEPELKKIKEQYKDNKEEQARQTLKLYKDNKTNPFSGIIAIAIQIPIVIALYRIFYKGVAFAPGSIYSFIAIPTAINMNFLGLIDIAKPSLFLAIIAGITQYLQAITMPKPAPSTGPSTGSFQESFTKSMNMQMKYVFPFLIFWISYKISGAVALYLIISNIFAVGQQMYLNRVKTTELALVK